MNSRLLLRRVAAALALLGSVFAGPAAAAQRSAGPALWQVSDADTTIYLFGTIHMLPKGTPWRSAEFDRALRRSDTLVLELVDGSPEQSTTLLASTGISPGLPPLAERLPADKANALARIMRDGGIPAGSFDTMESWAAALTLIAVSFSQTGFDSNQGVESVLTEDYKKAGKPIVGLETTAKQLGYLDSLSEDAQRALLEGAVEDPAGAKAELDRMLAAWMAGDTDAIAASFDAETQLSPELRDTLIHRRNSAWSDWIAKRMAQPGTLFLAVGAGHLAGPDSVQEMLKAKGLSVRRLN